MAHNLEMGSDGSVAFALRGAPAWHGLANQVFDADAQVTTTEMLSAAKLDNWGVRLEPVTFPADYRTVSDAFAVVRTNPFDAGTDVLSVVGDRYRVFQNEDLFAFGDALLDGGAAWESAGSIKQGRQVFGSLLIDRELVLDPSGIADTTKTYLLVTTSHDGSAAIQALVTPVRVVCQNTLNMAMNGASQTFRVRHTADTAGRVAAARQALGLTFAHMDAFDEMAADLFAASITAQDFDDLFTSLYPMPDVAAKAALTKWNDKRDLTTALYLNSPTQAGITGTAWGALNALTERVDWFRGNGKPMTEGMLSAASGFEAGINAEKARILKAVRALASA